MNALAKAGVEMGANGSIYPRPEARVAGPSGAAKAVSGILDTMGLLARSHWHPWK